MLELQKVTGLVFVCALLFSGKVDTAGGQQVSDPSRVLEEEGIEFVLIPAGSFLMGAPADEPMPDRDERPQHQVILTSSFYLSAYEITQAQFEAVMGENPSEFKGPDLPVDSVTWSEAVEFCRRMSERTEQTYRLPTEAEWEYACRAGTVSTFYWGHEMDGSYAWYEPNSTGRTHPVGLKKPNAWGLYDMCGNIEEWCSDWYAPDYGSDNETTDPRGPLTGQYRVRRGGCWDHSVGCLRSANRYFYYPERRFSQIGFRVVREVEDEGSSAQ